MIVSNSYYFHYKYAVVQDNHLCAWERGVDRVADLMIMPEARTDANYDPRKSFFAKDDQRVSVVSMIDGKRKQIRFNEKWEKMWVSFMVYYPRLQPTDQLLFTCEKVGVSKRPMKEMHRKFDWMEHKYGMNVRPWEIDVEVDNIRAERGQFRSDDESALQYHFSVRRGDGTELVEREPARMIDLQNPNKYRGQLGSQNSPLWLNTDRVWNVNGAVFKADGNFLNCFFFKKIGETPISLGSYAATFDDFSQLK